MKVAEFAQHVEDLAKFLEAGGAKGFAAELHRVSKCLVPFKDQTVSAFADFLLKADKFDRGELNIKLPKPDAKPKPSKPVPPDFEVVKNSVIALYERAGDSTLTQETITSELTKLDSLKKDQLVAVCKAMNLLVKSSQNIKQIKEMIVTLIIDRWRAAKVTGAMDNPLAPKSQE